MKRKTIILLLLIAFYACGCNESKQNHLQPDNKANFSMNQRSKENIVNTNSSSNSLEIEKNVLEDAQKNYQDSYNEYVRCLRESGPQTVETLQALTMYQKNYQIYQMLLNAESNKQKKQN